MENKEKKPLQFQSLSSLVDPSFWYSLTKEKIDNLKLSDEPIDIYGYYSYNSLQSSKSNDAVKIPSFLQLNSSSLNNESVPPFSFPMKGLLKNTNTIEDFQKLDKKALFEEVSRKIWESILSGEAIKCPALLNQFLLISFSDLKKYKYYYWFAFPALISKNSYYLSNVTPLNEYLNEDELQSLHNKYQKLLEVPDNIKKGIPGYFIFKKDNENNVKLGTLSEYESFTSDDKNKTIIAFADPCVLPNNPGWLLRNLLILIKKKWKISEVTIMCYREIAGENTDLSQCKLMDIEIPGEELSDDLPQSVGWEKNVKGQFGPRLANLGPTMDPNKLIESAVDLNLKLMRWRIMPSLDLEKISSTKCLLLGAGTLGSYVARSLMAWGIRHITFVDNGSVSYSNPVRQPLYEFKDCLNGGKPKAETAAESLKRIFPGIHSKGYKLTIPMPGHNEDKKITKENVELLEKLFDEHDAIFLLMDSRESRWLPTVLGAVKEKIVINAALGFDSFLVMRHGAKSIDDDSLPTNHGSKLGCYFCNDIVAPVDSLKDRTLDQQCTVTRPGLSAIASANAVELLVSIINSPDGINSKADSSSSPFDETPTPLGLIPHQIRGFLTHFNNLLVVGQKFSQCTACSKTVIDEYKKGGVEFVQKVISQSGYLEHLTGLDELHKEGELLNCDWDDDDIDSL